MKRLLSVLVLAVLPFAAAVPASAAPSTHDVYIEEYDAYEPLAAGDGEPCVPWSGTFHEVRSGEIDLVTVNSGPQAGEVHVNGSVAGLIEYIPDDGSLPSYSGSYREKLNGVLVELSLEDDQSRIAQFRLRSLLVGTDGSTLRLAMSGKITINRHGDVVIDRFNFTCE
ncbi:MAG: hypothetical protein ACRDTZ_19665 [Pseudonocardiaceae bacterium]